MTRSPPIIAVDGPSAGGKGTLSKKLATHFGFAHLDTGLLYRAVGSVVLTAGKDPSDTLAATHAAEAFTYAQLQKLTDEAALREPRVSDAASKVAAVPAVRAALLKFQQDFCARPPDNKPGAVLDGRDIGTVIAPHAAVKIYVTASSEARAERRFKELQAKGEKVSLEGVLADMKERDLRDASRSAAPTKPADDAVILDTTHLNAEAAFAEALKIAKHKLGQ
jgi:cytidylate kinase